MTKATAAARVRSSPARLLGIEAASPAALIRAIGKGLPHASLGRLAAASGIDAGLLAPVAGVPPKSRARLDPAASERLARLATVIDRALRLFDGDTAAAANWLLTPRRVLDNSAPLAYCRTELGAREVENLIGRLEHGVFS